MRTWSRGARPPSGAWISGRQYLPGHRGGRAGSATHIRAATEQISQFGRSKSANRDGQEAVQIRRFVRDWLRKWRVRCARAQGRGRARAGRSGMTVAIASLGACRVAGLSSWRCCVPSSRPRRRRWWFVAAAIPWTSCAFMLCGRRGPGRWTDSRCWESRSSRFSGCRLEVLLRRRFSSFRTIYLPTAGELGKDGFKLLATAQRPHFTVRLERADDRELGKLRRAEPLGGRIRRSVPGWAG